MHSFEVFAGQSYPVAGSELAAVFVAELLDLHLHLGPVVLFAVVLVEESVYGA